MLTLPIPSFKSFWTMNHELNQTRRTDMKTHGTMVVIPERESDACKTLTVKNKSGSDTGYDIIQELIRARKSLKLTQKDLSAVTGVTQADISRIESGSRNPSLKLVRRLAKGVGMELKLVPLRETDEESGKAQV